MMRKFEMNEKEMIVDILKFLYLQWEAFCQIGFRMGIGLIVGAL